MQLSGRAVSAPGNNGETMRWSTWKPDSNLPIQLPKTDIVDWRKDEIAKIQRELEASRMEEERMASEMRNNERILLHNTNELRHWRAAIQSRDAELVRRHEDDRRRMHGFLSHFKDRLDHERYKLREVCTSFLPRLCFLCHHLFMSVACSLQARPDDQQVVALNGLFFDFVTYTWYQSLLKCVRTSRTMSSVLESCAACEYELKGEDVPQSWGDRFPSEPAIFEQALLQGLRDKMSSINMLSMC